MRDTIILACTECKERNYNKTKNKRLHPERVEYKKYCPRCKTHGRTRKPSRRHHHAAGPSRGGVHPLHWFPAWLNRHGPPPAPSSRRWWSR